MGGRSQLEGKWFVFTSTLEMDVKAVRVILNMRVLMSEKGGKNSVEESTKRQNIKKTRVWSY